MARMVDACVTFGLLPFYGPFGDIKDTVGCEDQFRNAYLLGCVGAWSLHPAQIEIAKRVFSPRPADVAHAQRVIDAMGDGTGAIMLDGKMEDDASVKQCKVVVELARPARRARPAARRGVRVHVVTDLRPRRSVLYMPAANERALEKAKTLPADAIIFDLEDAVAPDAKESARVAACAAASFRRVRPPRADDPLQRPRHAVGRRRPGGDRRLDRGGRGRPQGQLGRLPRRGVAAARRRRRTRRDDRVGDDRDADGDLRRAGPSPPTHASRCW